MGVCCTTQALTLGAGAAASGVQWSDESYTLRFEGLEQSHPEMAGWDPRAGVARTSAERNRMLLDGKKRGPRDPSILVRAGGVGSVVGGCRHWGSGVSSLGAPGLCLKLLSCSSGQVCWA